MPRLQGVQRSCTEHNGIGSSILGGNDAVFADLRLALRQAALGPPKRFGTGCSELRANDTSGSLLARQRAALALGAVHRTDVGFFALL